MTIISTTKTTMVALLLLMAAVLVGIEVEEKNHSKKLKEKLVMKIKKTEG